MARREGYKEAWSRAWTAIRDGDDDALRRVLADRPDLAKNGVTISLMDDAADLGRASTIAVLLGAGFPADIPDGNGVTPLMRASRNGHIEAVRLLLEAGADPNAAFMEVDPFTDPAESGLCPLWGAICDGHHEVAELLLSVTSPTMRERAYRTIACERDLAFERQLPYSAATLDLLHTARCANVVALSWAIEDGGDVNLVLRPEESHSVFGSTPLSFAAARGRLDLVEALLQSGADPGLKDHLGRTAADLAAARGHAETASRLRAIGG